MALRDLLLGLEPAIFWLFVFVLSILGGAAFVYGVGLMRRAAEVANTSTSLIRSAAQGFTELEGRGFLLPGPPILAPLTGTACLWYRIRVVEYSEDDRRRVSVLNEETSDALFLLRDSSGECVVDPEGAAVNPTTSLTWRSDSLLIGVPPALGSGWLASGRFHFTEERLDVGTRLYVLGHFSTHGASQEVPRTREEVTSLLRQWKRDYPALLQRFDANGDGHLDGAEWERARDAAEKQVRRDQRERFGERTVSLISRPADGRAFVISTEEQERMVQRWHLRAFLGFGGFLAIVSLIAWAVGVRG